MNPNQRELTLKMSKLSRDVTDLSGRLKSVAFYNVLDKPVYWVDVMEKFSKASDLTEAQKPSHIKAVAWSVARLVVGGGSSAAGVVVGIATGTLPIAGVAAGCFALVVKGSVGDIVKLQQVQKDLEALFKVTKSEIKRISEEVNQVREVVGGLDLDRETQRSFDDLSAAVDRLLVNDFRIDDKKNSSEPSHVLDEIRHGDIVRRPELEIPGTDISEGLNIELGQNPELGK